MRNVAVPGGGRRGVYQVIDSYLEVPRHPSTTRRSPRNSTAFLRGRPNRIPAETSQIPSIRLPPGGADPGGLPRSPSVLFPGRTTTSFPALVRKSPSNLLLASDSLMTGGSLEPGGTRSPHRPRARTSSSLTQGSRSGSNGDARTS